MSKIKLGRVNLQVNKNPSSLINQSSSFLINAPIEEEPTFIIQAKETPIDCYPADYDCNYFLSSGCRATIRISSCQLGFPFTNEKDRIFLANTQGSFSYFVKSKIISRQALTLYCVLLKPLPVFSSTSYFLDLLLVLPSSTSYFK